MKRILDNILKKAYYIGFFCSLVLSLSFQESADRSQNYLGKTYQSEVRLKKLLGASIQLNQPFSLTSIAMAIKSDALLSDSVKNWDETTRLLKKEEVFTEEQAIKFQPYFENISKTMGYFRDKQKGEFQVTSLELQTYANSFINLNAALVSEGESEWASLVENYQSYIKSEESKGRVIQISHLVLSIFLGILWWTAFRRAKAETIVRASEHLHKLLFSSLIEGVLLVFQDGEIITCNEKAAKILGHRVEVMKGHKLTSVLPLVMREDESFYSQEDSPILKMIESVQAISNEVIGIFSRKGTLRWLSLSSQPLLDPMTGRFTSTIISISDITEQFELEKTVRAQQAQIISSSKLSALGEMASGIAHEINNPLAIIQSEAEELLEIAEDDELETESAKNIAGNISQTVTRIAKIIKGLRTFARDGKSDPMVPEKLKGIIDDTIALCQDRYNKRQISLEVVPVSEALIAECRATQISQVVLNLLNNASDAIEHMSDRWVRLEVIDKGPLIEIGVVDSGSGIPREAQDKMFQPFFTTKGVGKGTGLGLSIARGIIQGHGGNLAVDNSSPNTRFYFTLKKKQEQQGASTNKTAA